MTAPAPALEERLLREQVAALWSTTASATMADLAFSWIVALLFWWHNNDPLALAWLALRMLRMLRYRGMRAFHTDPLVQQRTRFWARKHVIELLIFSSTWGLAPWLMLPASDRSMTAVMVLVILGVCSTGLSAVTPRWPSVLAFALPMVLGLAGALLWQGGTVGTVLALCCLVYLAVSLSVARTQHRLLSQTLLSRFETEALAAQLQEQVRLTAQASKEKTRFLASASHDLRQPLHAIGLFGAALELELRGQPAHDHALQLQDAVRSLSSSLGAMLDISRLDAGVMAPDHQAVALRDTFLSMQRLFSGYAQAKDIELRIRTTALQVTSDPQLLERLLGNLVENAIKYTHRGGVLVTARQRGAQVWIDIVDTGQGIDQAHQELVFEEYFQVGNPSRDRNQGLGIGLSIVRRLAALLDHPVRLRSKLGRGSHFRVTLPAALRRSSVTREPTMNGDQTASLPKRVLLIDDEVIVAQGLRALMNHWGVELTAVLGESAARSALTQAAAQGRPVDVMISDMRLGQGSDGLSVALGLLSETAPQPALIMITGETSPEQLRALEHTALPVLFKTVDPVLLRRTLSEVWRQGRS